MKKALVLLCLAASTAFAETDYSTWYQFTGNKNTLCFTDACWVDPADGTETKTTAQSGRQYYVPAGKEAGALGGTGTFPGASLAVAGTLTYSKANSTYTVNDLILCSGGMLKGSTSHYVAGKLTVEGTVDNPSTWQTFLQSGRTWKYQPVLVGGSTAFLYVGSSGINERESLFNDNHNVMMDMSGYEGEVAFRGLRFVFAPSKADIPGKITVKSGAILEVSKSSGAYTVGSLAFEDGAELRLTPANNDCAYFSVSKEFSLGETFKLSGLELCGNGYYRIVQLTGDAAAAAPDVSAVQLDFIDKVAELPQNPRLELVDNGDGTKDVRVTWDEIAIMWTDNSNSDSTKSAFSAGNGSYWSTGVVPSSDFDGVAYATKNIMFWNYGQTHYDNMTLVLARGMKLYNQTYGLHLKEIQVAGSASIFGSNGRTEQPNRLYAPLRIYGGTCSFTGGWGNHWTELDGPISGSGTIVLGYGSAFGNTVNGDDSGFAGDYTVSGGISLDNPLTRPNFYVGVGGSFAFGGNYTGTNAWRSVYSTNAYYVISADVSMTNETRGVYLNQANVFEVAGNKSLTITESMTYNGTITKSGAGALVLGNEMTKFIMSGVQVDTPSEGLNGLTIAAGTLEVANVNAVNGLAVSFAEGTSLVVDPNATGDLLEKGAVNVKWATPFATTAASGKIPVVFKSENAPIEGASVAICTVTDTAAANLDFDVPENLGTRTVTTRWRPNDDGTQTFVADISARKGLFIIFQ